MHIQQLRYESEAASLKINDWKIDSTQHWGIFAAHSHSASLVAKILSGDLIPDNGEIHELPSPIACVSLERQQILLEEEIAKDETDFQDSLDYGTSVEQLILDAGCSANELERILDKTDLLGLRERQFRQLSTGETRRVMLARALVQKPLLLILDEPYTGLDTQHRLALTELLNQCATQIQLIIITSREDELPECITNVALFDHQSLTQTMSVEQWHTHPAREQIQALSKQKSDALLHLMAENPTVDSNLENLVSMKDVKVEYLDGIIFKDFNWQIKQGEHWQVRGPNGCGKSTLLGLIMGDHPQCYCNDISVLGMKRGSGETIWDIKKQIGIVSSALHLQYRVSCQALDVLLSGFFDSIGLYEKPSKKQLETAHHWLEVLEMREFASISFRSLDYGQQRLLLIGRALIKQPALLILDEPYQGLDFINRKLVYFALNRIAKANLSQLLYVTHYEEDALDAITHFVDFVPDREGHKAVTTHIE
ncbi:ATP-binding cassette domain-containing protein [Vibrio sp. ZSDE26]|uniref:ATP-binding cassette domain-containing protein n=1 Tax=Vibrio amylolyticus TaxID=2847292 RepID=A0A9X2BGU0_9VIBR|nr:ATP-binding cassette domain-containing protein [Vibrio amylolyticus]MCK6263226.1 ATP-binding cassette domain-containing protein [Vibrio amylolyticus]